MKIKIYVLATAIMGIIFMLSMSACSSSDDEDENDKEGNSSKVEAVDLGLSVKWADRNLGAEDNADYGPYFAWGELTFKEEYSDNTYKFFSNKSMSKYNEADGRNTLEPKDDAATVVLGRHWRIPTVKEIEELVTKCRWIRSSETDSNGDDVYGYRVVGLNGNSIFLPSAGYFDYNRIFSDGYSGLYWSSSLDKDNNEQAWGLESGELTVESRVIGMSIRPVYDK